MPLQQIKEDFYDLSKNPCKKLLTRIRNCSECIDSLPLGPRPVLNFHPESKILLVGQAPGTKVHESGIPWDDASGKRLREWMDISEEEFYDVHNFAIVPMGYCYPGKGKSGDLPPRKECADLWLDKILDSLKKLELVIVIGKYAQAQYIPDSKLNITEMTKEWLKYKFNNIPVVVLPHPSPRNNIWLKKNPWFEREVLPKFKVLISKLLVSRRK